MHQVVAMAVGKVKEGAGAGRTQISLWFVREKASSLQDGEEWGRHRKMAWGESAHLPTGLSLSRGGTGPPAVAPRLGAGVLTTLTSATSPGEIRQPGGASHTHTRCLWPNLHVPHTDTSPSVTGTPAVLCSRNERLPPTTQFPRKFSTHIQSHNSLY